MAADEAEALRRHRSMSVGHPDWGIMCCICFSGLTIEECFVDTQGIRWDVCRGQCAIDAGITEQPDIGP